MKNVNTTRGKAPSHRLALLLAPMLILLSCARTASPALPHHTPDHAARTLAARALLHRCPKCALQDLHPEAPVLRTATTESRRYRLQARTPGGRTATATTLVWRHHGGEWHCRLSKLRHHPTRPSLPKSPILAQKGGQP